MISLNTNLLQKLLSTYGPSGHELNISNLITEEIQGLVDDIKIDSLGNLIAHKKGSGPKIMLAGHMDQID